METPREAPRAYDVSRITEQLFVGSLPSEDIVAEVRALGVELVISMINARPLRGLTEPPFRLVRLPTLDFPLFPIPLRKLRTGVDAALPVLARGGRVLVYCRQGRHRSVVMACSILIATGMTADDAMATVMAGRAVADPHEFYIEPRIRAFERYWRNRQGTGAGEVAR